MTTINLHGILKFEFGEKFEIKLRKPKEFIDAITCSRERFRKRLYELSHEGLNFSLIVNNKNIKNLTPEELERPPKQIDVIPVIVGQGVVIAAVGAVALGVGVFAAATLGPTLAAIFVGVGIGLMSAGVQAMLNKRGGGGGVKTPEQVVKTASSIDQSFAFNTVTNTATQGSVVPVGYGRLRVGSLIIQSTVKSYPMNIRSTTVKASNYARADIQSGSLEDWLSNAEASSTTDWSTIESRLNQRDNE